MRAIALFAFACLALVTMFLLLESPKSAFSQEVQKYHVYCADDRVEVSFWDRAQMVVRRGEPVCLFATYTSYSDALTFAQKNFGGEGKPCYCQ